MPDFPSRRLHNHSNINSKNWKPRIGFEFTTLKANKPYVILYSYRIKDQDFHSFFKFVQQFKQVTTPGDPNWNASCLSFNKNLWDNHVTKFTMKWRSHEVSMSSVTGNLYIQLVFVPTEDITYRHYWGVTLLTRLLFGTIPLPPFIASPRINRERTAIKEWIKNTCKKQNYLQLTPLKFHKMIQLYRQVHLFRKDFKLSDLKTFKTELMNSNVFKLRFRLNRYKL